MIKWISARNAKHNDFLAIFFKTEIQKQGSKLEKNWPRFSSFNPFPYLNLCMSSYKCRCRRLFLFCFVFYKSSQILDFCLINSRGTKASIGNCATPAGNSLTRKSTNFETFFFLSLAVIKISVCYLQILKEESFTFMLICNLFQMEEFCSRELVILCCRFEAIL